MLEDARACLQVREEVNGKQETENGKKRRSLRAQEPGGHGREGHPAHRKWGGPLLRRGPASSFALGREGGNIPRDLEVLG